MKLVVTGTCGVCSRSGADSARKKSIVWSVAKRFQSSIMPWMLESTGRIWSKWVKRWLQKAVHQASFSASSDPYLRRSQSRNAARHSSQWHSPPLYSFETCQTSRAGWSL